MIGTHTSSGGSGRTSWGAALGFWNVISIVGWLVIAGVLISFMPDDAEVAEGSDLKAITAFAPAAGASAQTGK